MGNASQCNESDKNCPELSQKSKIFFSKEFLIDKEAGRAYSSFSRRDVAQSGSALEWGSRGRRFKSFHPDQKTETPRDLRKRGSLFCFLGICLFFLSLWRFLPVFSQSQGEPRGQSLLTSLSPTAGNRYRASPFALRHPHRQKGHGVCLRGLFAYNGTDEDGQRAAFPVDPLSRTKASPRDGPRVPFRLPSGKDVSWNSGRQPHPAF